MFEKSFEVVVKDLRELIRCVYVLKEHKIYPDLDAMIKITSGYIDMYLELRPKDEEVIRELVSRLKSPQIKGIVEKILLK